MAMLAEPKRRQKWTLNPRGKDWSEDANKFGQKMLEKMGWSSGKGLGANLDGVTDHVKVSFKNDSRGMGFKDRGDQWTQHETNFNSLLKSLSGENDKSPKIDQNSFGEPSNSGFGFTTKGSENIASAELSGVSLEEKSKNSRARVHYHKFTRGKDISRYSEKDLANIFGKKSLVIEASSYEDKATAVDYGIVKNSKTDKPECQEKEELSLGITTIQSTTSITDYFRSKINSSLRKSKYVVGSDGVLTVSKNTSNESSTSKADVGILEDITDASNENSTATSKKRKKKKSRKDKVECFDNALQVNEITDTDNIVDFTKIETEDINQLIKVADSGVTKKKKKAKKVKEECSHDPLPVIEKTGEEYIDDLHNTIVGNSAMNDLIETVVGDVSKRKKKDSTLHETNETGDVDSTLHETMHIDDNINCVNLKQKKMKKVNCVIELSEQEEVYAGQTIKSQKRTFRDEHEPNDIMANEPTKKKHKQNKNKRGLDYTNDITSAKNKALKQKKNVSINESMNITFEFFKHEESDENSTKEMDDTAEINSEIVLKVKKPKKQSISVGTESNQYCNILATKALGQIDNEARTEIDIPKTKKNKRKSVDVVESFEDENSSNKIDTTENKVDILKTKKRNSNNILESCENSTLNMDDAPNMCDAIDTVKNRIQTKKHTDKTVDDNLNNNVDIIGMSASEIDNDIQELNTYNNSLFVTKKKSKRFEIIDPKKPFLMKDAFCGSNLIHLEGYGTEIMKIINA